MAQGFASRSLHLQSFQVFCKRRTIARDAARFADAKWLHSQATRPLTWSTRSSTNHLGRIKSRPVCRQCRIFSSGNVVRQPNKEPKSPRPQQQHDDSEENTLKPRLTDSSRTLSQRVRERISPPTRHENIYTIPNILTFSRLLATPAIGYLVLHDNHVWAAGLFAYAGFSDLIDGWIARKYNLQTVVGSVIDPMADKALMTVLVGCLAIKGALPLWLATLIFGRDMSLGIAAIYYRYASLPAPKTFMRYWDFSIPSAEVHPTQVSKWNTFLQLGLIGCTVAMPLVTSSAVLANIDVHAGLQGFQYLVAGTTLWSGASYLWTRDAVVILGEDEALKKKQGFRGRAVLGISSAAFLALAVYLALNEKQQRDREESSGIATAE